MFKYIKGSKRIMQISFVTQKLLMSKFRDYRIKTQGKASIPKKSNKK